MIFLPLSPLTAHSNSAIPLFLCDFDSTSEFSLPLFISVFYLHCFPSCRHLDLSNNSLTTLPRETLATAPLLETLVLQENPWSCDCRMNWFLIWSLAHPGDCYVWNTICFHVLFCLPHAFYGGHVPLSEFNSVREAKMWWLIQHVGCLSDWWRRNR